jgi:F0F1-type ATP synthase assembly protein I
MMKYFLSVLAGVLAGGFVGAAVGVGVDQITQQSGWSLVIGTLGANGGAFWAALRRADGRTLWRERAGG